MHPLVFGKAGREVHAPVCERFGLTVDFGEWSAFRARAYLNGAPRLTPRPGALEEYRAAKAAGINAGDCFERFTHVAGGQPARAWNRRSFAYHGQRQ